MRNRFPARAADTIEEICRDA